MKNTFKHWKTTLGGFLISASAAAYPIVESKGFNPKQDWMLYLLIIMPVFVGAFMKDDVLKKK